MSSKQQIEVTVDEKDETVTIVLPLDPQPSRSGIMILLGNSRGWQVVEGTFKEGAKDHQLKASVCVGYKNPEFKRKDAPGRYKEPKD